MILIEGGKHNDSRGMLTYFNDLSLDGVKRFYSVEHPNTGIVRAWQGHKNEQKWFHVVSGEFKIVLIKPDDWNTPSKNLSCSTFEINDNQVLHVPGGFVSGFRALLPNSKMIVFSDFSLEESLKDDFRFDKDLWYKW